MQSKDLKTFRELSMLAGVDTSDMTDEELIAAARKCCDTIAEAARVCGCGMETAAAAFRELAKVTKTGMPVARSSPKWPA